MHSGPTKALALLALTVVPALVDAADSALARGEYLLHAAGCRACGCYLESYRLTLRALRACAESLAPGPDPGVP